MSLIVSHNKLDIASCLYNAHANPKIMAPAPGPIIRVLYISHP